MCRSATRLAAFRDRQMTSGAPITSEALLTHSDTLARLSDPTYSTTVHLRRAVSGAYYALFRELVGEATRRAVGPDPLSPA